MLTTQARKKQIKDFTLYCDPCQYENFFEHHCPIDSTRYDAAHAHNASFNQNAYERNDGYPPANALTNQDSYSSFSIDAVSGHPGLPGVKLFLGSLMSAEPQFYIGTGAGVDIKGPALDIFNQL